MDAKIILPIRTSLTRTDDEWVEIERAINKLDSFAASIRSPYLKEECAFQFKVVEKIEQSEKAAFRALYRNKGWMGRWTRAQSYLCTELSLLLKSPPILKRVLAEQNFTCNSEEACVEIALRRFAYEIEDVIFDLSVVGNLTDFGNFRFDDGALITDRWRFAINSVTSQCDDALELMRGPDWPPIRRANIQDVYGWYCTLDGTTKGHSGSPLGRALCAFTYLFHHGVDRYALTDLIWALAGVEALLGEADQSRRLITDKLLLIFPPDALLREKDLRRMIRDVYDFRSRMLHGNRNISSQRIEYDDDSGESKKYVAEEHAATYLSIRILSQLILHCYSTGQTEIRTKLVLEG